MEDKLIQAIIFHETDRNFIAVSRPLSVMKTDDIELTYTFLPSDFLPLTMKILIEENPTEKMMADSEKYLNAYIYNKLIVQFNYITPLQEMEKNNCNTLIIGIDKIVGFPIRDIIYGYKNLLELDKDNYNMEDLEKIIEDILPNDFEEFSLGNVIDKI